MKKIDLTIVEHSLKTGDAPSDMIPNIKEDCIFVLNGKPVGFYIHKIEGKMNQLATFANQELLSKRVPKSEMRRSSGVIQYSATFGALQARPHMRRPYVTNSSLHNVPTAKNFIIAMTELAVESEKLIEKYLPEQYEMQKNMIESTTPKEFRVANLFTSSISNCNTSAAMHQDKGNLKGCVNVIIIKKKNATGGNTISPSIGAVIDSCNDSLLCYPAVDLLHGVTPIKLLKEDGYRNSLVFYPLRLFAKE